MPVWQAALVLAPAVATAVAAWRAGAAAGGVPGREARAWQAAGWATGMALVAALLSLGVVLVPGGNRAGYGLRADAVGGLVLLLVAVVAWAIVRYSRSYLQGEPQAVRYVRWLMATVATVFVVVATNHLVVLVLAWTATSLALHQLLTFYPDRPAAVAAAHKKFIVARLADLSLAAGAVCLGLAFGTLRIDEIQALAAAAPRLPAGATAGAVLVALAAVLKCAQLPFHGWLIQVMEAPTPVSALLHAGVVNLGGFVLLRFSALVSEVPAAQALLLVAGTATAVLAALVMTTRISVKVMLAWSTCAQMGFMLMQCGLGAWDMALLHLLAHSLYKAHAFLSAGGVVRQAALAQMAPRAVPPGPAALLGGMLLTAGMVLAAAAAWRWAVPGLVLSPALWVLAGIVALALVPLVQGRVWHLGRWAPVALGLAAFGVALGYVGLHAALSAWLPLPAAPADSMGWVGVAAAFAALFAVQCAIAVAPDGPFARRLYPWFYGGLYLDEQFTQRAFAIWPPPVPQAPPPERWGDGEATVASALTATASSVTTVHSGAQP